MEDHKKHHHGPMSHMMANPKIINMFFLVLLTLAGFLFVQMVSEIKAYKFIGGGVPVANTITVSGEGEASAPADVANFSFSVIEEAATAVEAQDVAAKKMNAALALLEGQDIEEKDIKTSGYNVYPRYEWKQAACPLGYNCPGERTIVGYEVNQTVSVRVRDVDSAGDVLAEIGSVGVSNISGLSFTIDDQDELDAEARREAIDDAKEKAEVLARDLGVNIIRVVGFHEGGGYYGGARTMTASFMMEDAGGEFIPEAAELPVGENTVYSNVSITYEIR